MIAAVRDLNRLAGRGVDTGLLGQLVVAAPQSVAQLLGDSWGKRYAARIDTWRMPASETRKAELALAYGRDGRTLLKAVYAAAGSDPDLAFLARLHQVEVLRVVLLQNYVIAGGKGGREMIKRREAEVEGLPPGRSRITAPYDTDARWSVKRDTFWNGYKVHVTETCDTSADGSSDGDGEAVAPPHLIVNVETTDATVPDTQMTAPVHARLAGRDLRPAEHYVVSGYPSAELLVSSLAGFGITLVTPMLADTSPQARAGHGFDRSQFTIDFAARQATCLQGHASSSWNPVTQRGTETIGSPSRRAPAGPARPGPSATPRRPAAASSPCTPARSTRPSSPPGPPRTPETSRPDTRRAPASRAPSARASPSPACAASARDGNSARSGAPSQAEVPGLPRSPLNLGALGGHLGILRFGDPPQRRRSGVSPPGLRSDYGRAWKWAVTVAGGRAEL